MVRRLSCRWCIGRVAFTLAVLTALAWPAHAQVVGQIQGTVTDAQGFDTTVAVSNLDQSTRPDPSLFTIDTSSKKN